MSAVYLTARAVTDITLWSLDRGLPLDVEALFVEENVEHFTSMGLRHLAGHSRASYRSAMRRIARAITTKAPWPAPPPTYSRNTLGEPYTEFEIGWLRDIAVSQLTEERRRAALAVWCLSYGAGLRGPEFGTLPGSAVELVDGLVVVTVSGAYPRRIPVLVQVSDDLLELAAQYPHRAMFSDRAPSRGWTTAVLAQVELPDRAPKFSSRRFRVTWQVKLAVAGLRLSELAYLAGVETSTRWDDLTRWVPQRDFNDLRDLIGGIGD